MAGKPKKENPDSRKQSLWPTVEAGVVGFGAVRAAPSGALRGGASVAVLA